MTDVLHVSSEASDDYRLSLLNLINGFRQQANLHLLELSTSLCVAAQTHAEDMARNNYFSHTCLNGSSAINRAEKAGYPSSFVGENIASGNEHIEAVFEQWLNSSGHRENMLNEKYKEAGIGYVLQSPHTNDSHYWVLLLGHPNPQELIAS
ncbi:CAP domain-containing protein [Pantanalinema rosaneae CENA516]|uniref:CAP domain-containing protein n=1 Tax=Pantanalinema rosaneae TaxID=1620701 RepID=UPI003D6DDEBF